jgi:adenylate cyclase
MAVSARNTKKIVACLGVATATAALGAGYSTVAGGRPDYGATAGFLIGLLCTAFELFFVQTRAGAWLRRLPLPGFIAVATFAWAVLIGFSIYVAAPLVLGIELYAFELETREVSALAFAFGLAFLSTFFLRVQSLIGGRVLFNFFIGRYHRPAREERAFMFLDIADSTRLSEQFGDVKIQALIGRFFFDIARPIAEHGGETYR